MIKDMINRKKLLIRIISIIFLIFFLNLLASKFHWFFSIWWFDMPMHFLGGFWLGLILLWYFPQESLSSLSVLKIILGVLLIAIGWEIFEIVVDRTITQNPFNSLDTLSDLCFDLAGGFFAMIYFFKKILIK